MTLEQLDVVKLEDVHVDDKHNKVNIVFTPTIPHCSMATLIGLSIRVKLLRSLPPRFKVGNNASVLNMEIRKVSQKNKIKNELLNSFMKEETYFTAFRLM